MSTWAVLGSSPLAPQALEAARAEFDVDFLVTTNAGILLEPRPDFYFLNDQEACRRYMDQAKEAADHGCHCFAFLREPGALAQRGVAWMPQFIRMSNAAVEKFERNEYPGAGYSGNYIAQFACMRGAKRVLLCGQDGYLADCAQTADDWRGERYGWSDVRRNGALYNVIQPFFRRLAVIWPEVEFVQYGRPNFQVGEPNWRVVEVSGGGG